MKKVIVYADGEQDDTDAIELIINGKAEGIFPDGAPITSRPAKLCLTRPVIIESGAPGFAAIVHEPYPKITFKEDN